MKAIPLEPSADLSDYWYNISINKYLEEYKEWPTGIIISSTQLPWDITFIDLKVTMLSGLPDYSWMVYGKKGIIYSPGA